MSATQPLSIGILGAGPAGLSAALWLKNLGFAPWLADPQEDCGGILNLNFLVNDWVLGQEGLTGPELAKSFANHVHRRDIAVFSGHRPERIERVAEGYTVRLAGPGGEHRTLSCAALLIATGTRFCGREVFDGLPGRDEIPAECWAFGPYAFADLANCRGRRVLIVGGGDNAFENARLLLGSAASVDMALRSPPRAQRSLRAAAAAVRLHSAATLSAVAATDAGICVTLRTPDGTETLHVDRIHVLVGYTPNTPFLRTVFADAPSFDFDKDGYLRTDDASRTGVPGVYAAGDVCNRDFPSVAAALAAGARAAKTIELDLRHP
jgi:thioredoxin reductase